MVRWETEKGKEEREGGGREDSGGERERVGEQGENEYVLKRYKKINDSLIYIF